MIFSIDHSNHIYRDSILFIDWNLGNFCNYSCSYCPDNLHNGSIGFHKFEDIINFIKHLKEQTTRKLYFHFVGGEPTIYKKLPDLLEYLNDNEIYHQILTNGSRELDYWIKNKNVFQTINISFHLEFAKKDHILNLIKSLNDQVYFNLKFLVVPNRLKECLELSNFFDRNIDKNLNISLVPLHKKDNVEELMEYNSNILDIIGKFSIKKENTVNHFPPRTKLLLNNLDIVNSRYIKAQNLNKFNGWMCNAGVEFLQINMNGNMYRGVCGVGGIIGNIKNEINLPKSMIKCDKDVCSCLNDITITKKLIEK